jgi:hypothetical protein
MINLTETILTNCIIHKVGNQVNSEKLILNKEELELDDSIEPQLKSFFLKSFKTVGETFQFTHDTELNLNEVYNYADKIFEGEDFVKNSISIAKHLFKQTRNHNIKAGDLFIAMFEDIILDDVVCKGLGIFKSEKKEFFFKTSEYEKGIELLSIEGINQHKLDKGCLILNDDYHEGFKLYTYELNGGDTDYWRNDFLNIKVKENNFYQTKNFLNACKEFIEDELPSNIEMSKAEQVNILNKSVEYFKKNKDFKEKDFTSEVFQDKEIIKSFKTFKQEFQKNNDLVIEDSFVVSAPAVKKQAKLFKSVVKLDKNFHIYIHGDEEMIERGTEKDGRKFYKIYYENEL